MDFEKVKKVLDYGKENIASNPALFVEFSKVYVETVGTESPLCTTCPDGFSNAYDYLEATYNKLISKPKITMNPNAKFKLKDNAILYSVKMHQHFSNVNITDDDAIKLLAESKNHSHQFVTKPDNWEELVDQHLSGGGQTSGDSEEVKKLKTLNKEELKAEAAKLEVPAEEWENLNKKDLLEYLIAKTTK